MNTVLKYLEEMRKKKERAQARFSDLTKLEQVVVDGAFSWLLDNLKIEYGVLSTPDNILGAMNDFVNVVTDGIVSNRMYEGRLSNYLTDLKTIGASLVDMHRTVNEIDTGKLDLKGVQKNLLNAVIDQYTENGLNRGFVAPLKDMVQRNVLAGVNQQQIKGKLREYVESGKDGTGKLRSYLEQTSIQAVDSFTGAINTQVTRQFATTGFIISGSAINTTSKQCRYALDNSAGGYLSNEQWEKVLEIARKNAAARLIEGTDLTNLPLNKLHWGCRHEFTPVIKRE